MFIKLFLEHFQEKKEDDWNRVSVKYRELNVRSFDWDLSKNELQILMDIRQEYIFCGYLIWGNTKLFYVLLNTFMFEREITLETGRFYKYIGHPAKALERYSYIMENLG